MIEANTICIPTHPSGTRNTPTFLTLGQVKDIYRDIKEGNTQSNGEFFQHPTKTQPVTQVNSNPEMLTSGPMSPEGKGNPLDVNPDTEEFISKKYISAILTRWLDRETQTKFWKIL